MIFLWYPKCSTCQKAKKWLDAHGIQAQVRDISLPLKKFFNTSGQSYRALGLRDRLPGLDRGEQLALLAGDGMLVKRPILVDGDRVLVGFQEAGWSEALL